MNRPTSNDGLPLVAELPGHLTAVDAFRRLAHLQHVVFFDSMAEFGRLGRYSFVAADPFKWIESAPNEADPLANLAECWHKFQTTSHPELPPFQGGVAGLFAYDLGRSLERLPEPQTIDLPLPELAVGFYDVVLAFDHLENRAWLISQGFPELDPASRRQRAQQRFAHFAKTLEKPPQSLERDHQGVIRREQLAQQFDVGLGEITSNMSSAEYQRMVKRAVEYIHAGDVFK